MEDNFAANSSEREELLEKRVAELSASLEEEKVRFAIASDFSDCAIWEYNIAQKTQYQYKKLAGRYSDNIEPIPNFRQTVIGWGIIYAEDLPLFNDFCDRMDKGEPKIVCDLRSYDDDFNYRRMRYEGMTVCDDDGKPVKVVGRTLDVTKEYGGTGIENAPPAKPFVSEEGKADNEHFYTGLMLDNQQPAGYVIDPDTYEITYVSRYASEKFPDIRTGEKCYKCIMGNDAPCKECPAAPIKESGARTETELYSDKYDCWFRYIITRVNAPDGKERLLICVNDISSFLERVSTHDNLTGLATFDRFTAEAGKALTGGDYAVAVISVCRFRAINEKYGIGVGNRILTGIAAKIKASLGKDEYSCRWGGGKFILMFKNTPDAFVRISTLINTASSDIYSAAGVKAGFYAGLYRVKKDCPGLITAIDRANAARKTIDLMYSAECKAAEFDEEMEKKAHNIKRLESIMQEALENHEYRAFYQPKVRLSDGEISGAEALVRWIRPDGEFISPGQFIPAFEENGFVTELDFEVYSQVFSDLRRWIDMGLRVPVISVNVSRRHFIGDDFPDKIEALRAKYNVPHKYVELEITESMFSNNLNHVIDIVNTLRDYGFSISVDDFGSGYSNLNLITKLPVDVLKVDGGFFMDHSLGAKDRAVISTIISLAHSLNLYVVSEGIENKVQVDFLSRSGCDSVQGYFFYKPMAGDKFEKLLK